MRLLVPYLAVLGLQVRESSGARLKKRDISAVFAAKSVSEELADERICGWRLSGEGVVPISDIEMLSAMTDLLDEFGSAAD